MLFSLVRKLCILDKSYRTRSDKKYILPLQKKRIMSLKTLIFQTLFFVFGYFLPLLIIVCLYSVMINKLFKQVILVEDLVFHYLVPDSVIVNKA